MEKLLIILGLMWPQLSPAVASASPNITVGIALESGQGIVRENEAAYVDFSCGHTRHVEIKCAMSELVNDIDAFEIWLESGTGYRITLFDGSATHSHFNEATHTLTAATFQSGKYGCSVRRGHTVTHSRGAVYLSTEPTPVLRQKEKEVHIGDSAIFTCEVNDEFGPFDIVSKVDCLYKNGSEEEHRLISSWTPGEWKVVGNKLTLYNLQNWARNVTVACRVSGASVRGSTSDYEEKGWSYRSGYVPISFSAPPPSQTPTTTTSVTTTSTPPSTTPSVTAPTPTTTPSVTRTSWLEEPLVMVMGSVVVLALAIVIAPVLVMVVFVRRTGRPRDTVNVKIQRPPSTICLGQAPLTSEQCTWTQHDAHIFGTDV